MGVQGLWELLRPAAVKTSLAALGRDAFLANRNGLRAFVIGVDASIWIFHAKDVGPGSNPFERTLFYKIAHLLQHPVLPVFVFDGPNKPMVKRNQRVHGQFGTNDAHSIRFKRLLDACGLEWWNAPGEAEAELALMNRQGKIDAVLSDDVDSLLFGAKCVLRNNSPTLSGATETSGRAEGRHYDMFRSCDIRDAWAKEGSTLETEDDMKHAMVLIALLSGGDYVPDGMVGLGPTIAMGLAHAGASNFLKLYNTDRPAFDKAIPQIHRFMVNELQTNDSKFIGRKNPDRARKLQAKLPSEVFGAFPLESYLRPARSPEDDLEAGWPGFGKGEASSTRGMGRYGGRWSLESCAEACERFFEWGTIDRVCKKFATENGLFSSEVMNEARLHVLDADRRSRRKSTLSRLSIGSRRITSFFDTTDFQSASLPVIENVPRHILKVHSIRPSPMCSEMTDFRLGFQTNTYIERCRNSMKGFRVDPSQLTEEERASQGLVQKSKDTADTAIKDEIRTWIPDYLIRAAWLSVAEDYDAAVAAKQATPKKKTTKKGTAAKKNGTSAVTTENVEGFAAYFKKDCAKSPSPLTDLSSSLSSISLSDVPSSPTPSRRRKKTTPLFAPALPSPPSPEAGPSRPAHESDSASDAFPRSACSSPTPAARKPRARKKTPDTTKAEVATPRRDTVGVTAPSRPASRPRTSVSRSSRSRKLSTPPSSPDIVAIDTPPIKKSPSRRKKASPRTSPTDKRIHSDSSLSQSAALPKSPKKKNKSGTVDQPIDLCDSDDEPTPKARRKPVSLSPLPRRRKSPSLPPLQPSENTVEMVSSSPTKVKSKPKGDKPKSSSFKSTKPKSTKSSKVPISSQISDKLFQAAQQATLDSLVVARPRRNTTKPSKSDTSKSAAAAYTLEMDDEGVEHLYLGGKPRPQEF